MDYPLDVLFRIESDKGEHDREPDFFGGLRRKQCDFFTLEIVK